MQDDYVEQGADVIVFPEYGLLTTEISSLSRSEARPFLQRFPPLNTSTSQLECPPKNEAEDDQLAFTHLSCYALQNAIYVVANVGEVFPCNPGENVTDSGGMYQILYILEFKKIFTVS